MILNRALSLLHLFSLKCLIYVAFIHIFSYADSLSFLFGYDNVSWKSVGLSLVKITWAATTSALNPNPVVVCVMVFWCILESWHSIWLISHRFPSERDTVADYVYRWCNSWHLGGLFIGQPRFFVCILVLLFIKICFKR